MQTTLNFSLLSIPLTLTLTLLSFLMLYNIFLLGWLQTSHQTQATTGPISQLLDRNDTLCSQSWHNLWWTSHFLWLNIIIIQILPFSHRALHCIRPYLDFRTANTIATSIIHSKLDYCNSLYSNLPNSQINRLQQIQNSRSHCCQISQVLTHHSCNQVSALVKGQGTYWVQAFLSHI